MDKNMLVKRIDCDYPPENLKPCLYVHEGKLKIHGDCDEMVKIMADKVNGNIKQK